MAVPSLTKTWQFNVNNLAAAQGTVGADARLLLYNFVTAMIGFGSNPWVVDYSCLSATAGTKGDGVNRWTSAGALVWAAAGTAHSWMVLKQTGIASTYEILFDCSSATTGTVMTIAVSFSAGFTGGTNTTAPTATDQQNIINNGLWLTLGSDLGIRWSVMQSSDGACTRMFAFAGGTLLNGYIFDTPANTTTGWSNPSFTFAGATAAAFNAATLGGAASGYIRNGTTTGTSAVTVEATMAGTLMTAATVPNDIDSNWPMLPIGIYSTTTNLRGRQGTFVDLWAGSSTVATGDTYPATGNNFIQIGVLIFPWSGVAPSLS